MQPVVDKVLKTIRGHGLGWVFSPANFRIVGTHSAVESALRRLKKEGIIRHLARGLYDYPRKDPDLGILAPSLNEIIKALEARDAVRLQPSGAYAANLLGLTNQVPMRLVFLTDGPERKLRIGKRTIHLRHTTPKNMATAGRVSGTVIHALRWLGKNNIDENTISVLANRLDAEDKVQLLTDIHYAPAWIAEVIRVITSERETQWMDSYRNRQSKDV